MTDGSNEPRDQSTSLSGRLWNAYHLAIEVETCERAIAEYAAAGFSGNVHDMEHHQMRDAAVAKLKEHLSCLSL